MKLLLFASIMSCLIGFWGRMTPTDLFYELPMFHMLYDFYKRKDRKAAIFFYLGILGLFICFINAPGW